MLETNFKQKMMITQTKCSERLWLHLQILIYIPLGIKTPQKILPTLLLLLHSSKV